MSEFGEPAAEGAIGAVRDMIGAAIACIPSGCCILTVRHGDRSTGMLVSWVQQASFEPPSIVVAIKRGRPAATLIDESGRFILNVIGEDPTALFRHFGKGFAPEDNAFRGIEILLHECGVLLKESPAHLACRVTQKVTVGDHELYVAEVVEGGAHESFRPYVHIRNSGFSY